MSNLKEVNSLIRSNKKIEVMSLLESLIESNPDFKDYYISYLLCFNSLPNYLGKIASDSLIKSDLDEVLDLQVKLDEIILKKWNNVKFTFCISVKNRSCVNVSWDGVTKNKTFVTSYKKNPMNFQLDLLKNFVKSIVDSKINGICLEIIIVDFNSDDHPPEDWINEIVGVREGIEAKVIKSDEPFSRGRGLNIAAEKATGDILFFTDADMLISKEFLIQSLQYAYDKQKPFFPICYSYYTPYNKEGWIRDEGWGNLVIPKVISEKISWWEKRSWGSEDNHMKDQLGDSFIRAQAAGLYHQWHPEDDFKTKYYSSEKNKFEVVLAVTTYNRLDYLEVFIKTWLSTRNPYYKWHLIINDDGSTDGTIEYLKNINIVGTEIHIIYNNRKGVHEGTNAILDRINKIKPDYVFKCDDDVIFVKKGWDNAYIDGMNEFGFLCNYQTKWRDAKVKSTTDKCISYSSAYYSQGAFLAFNMDVVNKIGWFDTKSFGFKGYGHIDFAVRACRAGFNNINTLYDIKNSSSFITLQFDDYKPALDSERIVNEFKVDLSEDSKESFKDFILKDRSNLSYIPRSSIFEYKKSELKPKLHMIIHNNHIGGAEYVHFNHAYALRTIGFDIVIWSVGSGYYLDKYLSNNFETHYVPNFFEEKDEFNNFANEVEDGNYIYNCNAYNDKLFEKMSYNKHFYYLTIMHSDVEWIIKYQKEFRFFTHRYIAIHNYIKEDLVNAGVSTDKVNIVNNTLNHDFSFEYYENINLELRRKLKIPKDALVVSYIGRVAKDKNLLNIVDLAETVTKQRKDIYFIIVGGKSDRVEDSNYFKLFEQKLLTLQDNKKIIYLGELLGKELEDFYNVIDVAVNLSPSEGLPITMLEQLGKGIYCIYPQFPAINITLKEFNSKLIPIKQRKDMKNLEYSETEINLYAQHILSLNRECISNFRNENIKLAKNKFSSANLARQLNKSILGLGYKN